MLGLRRDLLPGGSTAGFRRAPPAPPSFSSSWAISRVGTVMVGWLSASSSSASGSWGSCSWACRTSWVGMAMVGSSPLRLGLVLRLRLGGAAGAATSGGTGAGSVGAGPPLPPGRRAPAAAGPPPRAGGLLELLRVELRHRALRQQVPDLAEQGVQVLLGLHGLFLRRGLLNGRLLRGGGLSRRGHRRRRRHGGRRETVSIIGPSPT